MPILRTFGFVAPYAPASAIEFSFTMIVLPEPLVRAVATPKVTRTKSPFRPPVTSSRDPQWYIIIIIRSQSNLVASPLYTLSDLCASARRAGPGRSGLSPEPNAAFDGFFKEFSGSETPETRQWTKCIPTYRHPKIGVGDRFRTHVPNPGKAAITALPVFSNSLVSRHKIDYFQISGHCHGFVE